MSACTLNECSEKNIDACHSWIGLCRTSGVKTCLGSLLVLPRRVRIQSLFFEELWAMIGTESRGPYSICAATSVLYIHKTLLQENLFFHRHLFLSTPTIFQHVPSFNPLMRFNYIQSFPSSFIPNVPDTSPRFANMIMWLWIIPSSTNHSSKHRTSLNSIPKCSQNISVAPNRSLIHAVASASMHPNIPKQNLSLFKHPGL